MSQTRLEARDIWGQMKNASGQKQPIRLITRTFASDAKVLPTLFGPTHGVASETRSKASCLAAAPLQ
jgi:hypothetical protein